jgi:hypothetical protein
MSTLLTQSVFYYGHIVTGLNRSIDFDEGGLELKATLRVGNYSATEYAAEWQRALRIAGTQNYVVTLNRATQKLTVSAPLNFTLRRSTGSRIGTSAWVMSGFGLGPDLTGSASYTAAGITGKKYRPQYILESYTSPEHSIVKESATVNDTPAGLVQQLSFGDGTRITMNIHLITDKTGLKNINFFENVNGISDALDFMSYLLTKGRVEFMPNINATSNFVKCFLDSTKDDRDAKRFVLKNMKVPDFYETGVLVFRKVLA